MKRLLVVSAIAALGFSSIAFAGGLPEEMPAAPVATASGSDTGVYVGLAGGFGITNWKDYEHDQYTVNSDNGAVGRALVGFDVTRYIALELGYTYFFNKAKFLWNNVENDKVKRTHAIDLMAKIKAPIVDNFDLYGKVGANYLMTSFDYASACNNFNVAYGAGADYYITSNIIANVEWLRFNGNNKFSNDKYQPHTDAFLVGLRYRFDI